MKKKPLFTPYYAVDYQAGKWEIRSREVIRWMNSKLYPPPDPYPAPFSSFGPG